MLAPYPTWSASCHALRDRFQRQCADRDSAMTAALAETLAVTFRPGDRTETFQHKTLRRLGASVAVVLTNGIDGYQPVVAGYRGMLHADGSVGYGLADDCEFRHRADLMPGSGGAIDPARNPSLVETLLRLDKACLNATLWLERMPEVPEMPRIYLGFPPSQPPMFEATPALRRRAAARIGISLAHLEGNPEELSGLLLRQTWEAELLEPGTVKNPTEWLLIDAEVCTQARQAVVCFEDFGRLVGAATWNPVRAVRLYSVINPAATILREHGLKPGGDLNGIDHVMLERLEKALRTGLGDQAVHFSQDDLFEALTEPDLPLLAITQALPRLRSRLSPYYSECSTDEDLRRAARRPGDPLRASGACRVQSLRKRPTTEPYFFGEDELHRRMQIDWGTTTSFRRKRSRRQEAGVACV